LHTLLLVCSGVIAIALSAFSAGLALPPAVHSQDPPPGRTVTDRNEVQVLDFKPGCWLLGTHVSIVGLIHQQSKEEIRSQEPTEAGQQALLKKIKEKYKIKVVDPDFFNGQKTP